MSLCLGDSFQKLHIQPFSIANVIKKAVASPHP